MLPVQTQGKLAASDTKVFIVQTTYSFLAVIEAKERERQTERTCKGLRTYNEICNGYRRRKWTQRQESKSWTRLIAFHIALIHLGKV